jgi:hypothetical protein
MSSKDFFYLPQQSAAYFLYLGLSTVALGLTMPFSETARAAEPYSERVMDDEYHYDREYQAILDNLSGNPRLRVGEDPGSISKSFSDLDDEPDGLGQHKFDRYTRVRGWQMSPNTYFGQAKVMDQWGVGVVMEKDDYVFGINSRGLSTSGFGLSVGKRF